MADQTVVKNTPTLGRSATKFGANIVKISAASYDRFLTQVDKESHLYSILKGGLIFDDDQCEGKVVQILCDPPAVDLLLESARTLYPEAVREIKQSIRSFMHAKRCKGYDPTPI
jgi:hypothetical protein